MLKPLVGEFTVTPCVIAFSEIVAECAPQNGGLVLVDGIAVEYTVPSFLLNDDCSVVLRANAEPDSLGVASLAGNEKFVAFLGEEGDVAMDTA
jgi:hypothetical protein